MDPTSNLRLYEVEYLAENIDSNCDTSYNVITFIRDVRCCNFIKNVLSLVFLLCTYMRTRFVCMLETTGALSRKANLRGLKIQLTTNLQGIQCVTCVPSSCSCTSPILINTSRELIAKFQLNPRKRSRSRLVSHTSISQDCNYVQDREGHQESWRFLSPCSVPGRDLK